MAADSTYWRVYQFIEFPRWSLCPTLHHQLLFRHCLSAHYVMMALILTCVSWEAKQGFCLCLSVSMFLCLSLCVSLSVSLTLFLSLSHSSLSISHPLSLLTHSFHREEPECLLHFNFTVVMAVINKGSLSNGAGKSRTHRDFQRRKEKVCCVVPGKQPERPKKEVL